MTWLLMLALLSGAGLFLLVFAYAHPSGAITTAMLRRRLEAAEGAAPEPFEETQLRRPLRERVLEPAAAAVLRLVASQTPERARLRLQQRLAAAGRPYGLEPAGFMAVRYLAAALLGAGGLGLGLLLGRGLLWPALLTALGAAAGFYLPALWLGLRGRRRRQAIARSLPDGIDLLTVAVEAGLSLDAAFDRVSQDLPGPLGEEFGAAVLAVRLGRSRGQALEEMAARAGVEEMHGLVQTIVQSDQMGVAIGSLLRAQSAEIRRARRQRIQEQAAQAGLKMLFPMIGCIFPTLWIILLGPGVILVMSTCGR